MVEVVEEEVLLMTASIVGVDRRLLMAATKTATYSSPPLFIALPKYLALGSLKTCCLHYISVCCVMLASPFLLLLLLFLLLPYIELKLASPQNFALGSP